MLQSLWHNQRKKNRKNCEKVRSLLSSPQAQLTRAWSSYLGTRNSYYCVTGNHLVVVLSTTAAAQFFTITLAWNTKQVVPLSVGDPILCKVGAYVSQK